MHFFLVSYCDTLVLLFCTNEWCKVIASMDVGRLLNFGLPIAHAMEEEEREEPGHQPHPQSGEEEERGGGGEGEGEEVEEERGVAEREEEREEEGEEGLVEVRSAPHPQESHCRRQIHLETEN